MVSLISQWGHKNGTYEYVIDTLSDLENVPTDVAVGTVVFCIENSKTYMLNGSGVYVEVNFKKGGKGGDKKLGSKEIYENGVYRAESDELDGFTQVEVEVANSYVASDEGKVVDNGVLVAQSGQTVTQNNTYDTTLINSMTVNVSGSGTEFNILNNIISQNQRDLVNGDMFFSVPTPLRLYSITITKANRDNGDTFNYVSASGIKLVFSAQGMPDIDTSQTGILVRGYSNKAPDANLIDAFDLSTTSKSEYYGLPVIFYALVDIPQGYYLSDLQVRYRDDYSSWRDNWNTFTVTNEEGGIVVANESNRHTNSWAAYPDYNSITISNDTPKSLLEHVAYINQNGTFVPITHIYYTTN